MTGTIAGIICIVIIGFLLSILFRFIGSKLFNFSEIIKKFSNKSEKK